MNTGKRLRCTVSPQTARMLQAGHPWVLADKYTAKWRKVEAGTLAELIDVDGGSLGTALLDPGARIVARLLSPHRIELNHAWLQQRIRDAEATRRWLDLGDTTVFRLVNGEGDRLPGLCVDRYGEHLLVQYYTSAWKPHLDRVVATLEEVYRPQGIYAKLRPQETRKLEVNHQAKGWLVAGSKTPVDHLVREFSLVYRVDLVEDMHTGLFLDQRDNRLNFRRFAAGNRVLNLFAYTGSFSVAAAAGGASSVTSVDVAGRYLDWAKENFRLNEIDPGSHEFITGDCFIELKRMAKAGRRFDVILMDPPSFSSTHKSRFTTSGGTAELVQRVLQLLEPGGLLITSSNLQKMPLENYLKELRKGSRQAGRGLKVIEVSGQGGDYPFPVGFPEGRYLKYVVSVVQD